MARIDMPEGANAAVPGNYSLINAAISNRGNPTSGGFGNLMVVEQNQPVRIVDNKTGEVVFEGIGPDAARRAVELGQNISDTKGNKAAWSIQTVPVGAENYATIANEKANRSDLARIADVALPTIGAILGGPLGAAAGSAASSAAQGRDIKDLALRAAISAGASALAPGSPTPSGATVGSNLPSWGSMVAPYASGAGGAVGSAASSAASPIISDIIVTGARNAVPSSLFPAVTGGISNTLLDQIANQPVSSTQSPEATAPTQAGDIIVTAKDAAPTGLFPATTGGISNTLVDQTAAQTPDSKGFLKKPIGEWGVGDWLDAASLGSLGLSGIGGLLGAGGGGGGASTAVPYVSPFGSGGLGLGAGQDMRVNPNISDYERYGFGPEASFFAPGYSQIVSSGANAPAAPTTTGPQAAMLNPQYVPLI